jgi:alcohol dehydrogenase class IV
MTGAPHGALCGALLPHVLRLHADRHEGDTQTGGRMAEVASWLSATFGAGDGIGALEGWIHENGLPRLSALGLRRAEHQAVATAAQASSSMKADPTGPSVQDLVEILQTAG